MGQRCVAGVCEVDPCGAPCTQHRVCDEDTGECVDDPCAGEQCNAVGQWCDPQTGDCAQDPCLGVTCPAEDQVCDDGTCYDPAQLEPDVDGGVGESYVAPGGGGGCAAGGGTAAGAALILLLAAAASARRSRRVVVRGRR